MHGGVGLLAFGLTAVVAFAGASIARLRVRRRWERTGGLDQAKDRRWNIVLLALIVVPAFILMVVQLLLR